MKVRKGPADISKPWWQVFLESAGGAALITVLIGGIMGGGITLLFSHWEKERDQVRLSSEAAAAREKLSYERLFDKRLGLAKHVFDIEGQSVSRTENLLRLLTPGFTFCSTTGQERHFRNDYNEADTTWREQRKVIGLSISYYNPGDKTVSLAWTSADQALTEYMECASGLSSQRYDQLCMKHQALQEQDRPDLSCTSQRQAVDRTFNDLQRALGANLGNSH
jgi:hypothetical protein